MSDDGGRQRREEKAQAAAAIEALWCDGWEVDAESYETLDVARRGHIAQVILKGPGKGNAMAPTFWGECAACFEALGEEDAVRAVVVRGRGDTFTYGLDLMRTAPVFQPLLMGDVGAAARHDLYKMVGRWQRAFDAIELSCTKPVIAAIDGWCIGGGVNLIAACDMRVCTAQARFSLREVKLAIVADLGALARLPHLIGAGWTRRLAMTGEDVGAGCAERIGLVEEVVEGAEALVARAVALAEACAANPPLTVAGVKTMLVAARDMSVAQSQQLVAAWNAGALPSGDLGEAMLAFMEGRAPVFSGQ